MSRLRIPAVLDGSGQVIAATAGIRLERAPQTPQEVWAPAIGFVVTALATEYASLSIPAEGLLVDLAPQSAIAMPDGSETAYAIRIYTRHRTALWRVQVPNSTAVLDLADLVGAQLAELGPPLWESLLAQTAEDRAATAADRLATGNDLVDTSADAAATAADRVQTGLDRVATGEDRAQTELDRVATGEDRTQTGLDRIATGADAVATAADRAAVDDRLGSILFLTAETAISATLGAGDAVVVGTGTDPYDHIILALEIP